MLVQRFSRQGIFVIVAALALVTATVWFASSRASAASQTPSVYVVTGENFPDALGVGPASALARGPILMVRKDSVPSATAAELSRLAPDRIFLIGGTAVISTSVEQKLGNWAPVTRIAGANRYETAALVSKAGFPAPLLPGQIDTFYVAESPSNPFSGNGFALELDVFATSPSWLTISGQASLDSTSSLDIVACGVTVGTDSNLALKGSWRYPTVSADNPLPTCASQARVLVFAGSHTVRLNMVEMKAGTTAEDRSLMVTVVPLFDNATTLSEPTVEGPKTLPAD